LLNGAENTRWVHSSSIAGFVIAANLLGFGVISERYDIGVREK
jgi:hypothetical protein